MFFLSVKPIKGFTEKGAITMAYSTTNKQEHRIRTLKIRGIAVSVSHQAGGLLIRGLAQHKGKSVQITGSASGNAYGVSAKASFVQFGNQYAAVFNRLKPGNYYASSSIAGHGWEDFTITTGYVSQLDWT
jgi:hypothetical protein